MDIREQRDEAVAGAMAAIRDIEQGQGVTTQALDAIKGMLFKLADQRSLFPEEHFPVGPEDGNSVIYRLSEDADHRFALYASTALPGKGVPPHNHTTWAVIVGIHGDEHNILYERADDGSQQGIGELHQTGEFTVTHGVGVTLMTDDIHSIHVTGEKNSAFTHVWFGA